MTEIEEEKGMAVEDVLARKLERIEERHRRDLQRGDIIQAALRESQPELRHLLLGKSRDEIPLLRRGADRARARRGCRGFDHATIEDEILAVLVQQTRAVQ